MGKIKLIAAISSNNVIGNKGDLIFSDKEDMKHFREATTGNVVIMGRKTWDSIPLAYRPFKDRDNVIISRNRNIPESEDCMTLIPNDNITKEIIEYVGEHFKKDVFIIGGGEIYKQTIDFADELIISEFPQEVPGDTFFPYIDLSIWKIKEEKSFTNFTLKIYERK
jgi:dihydrofolate reductase